MWRLCGSIALRLALCAALAVFVQRHFGLASAVGLAPLVGIALARPLLELAGGLRDLARQRIYRDVAGRYFEHRGQAIDVIEDEAGQRWLRTADLRKLIPVLPRDDLLRRIHAGDLMDLGTPPTPRILADALADYLAKSSDADSLRLRNWLEREVSGPARRRRERR